MSPWKDCLAKVQRARERLEGQGLRAAGDHRLPTEIHYVVDLGASAAEDRLILELVSRSRGIGGKLRAPRRLWLSSSRVKSLPESADRDVLSALTGGHSESRYPWGRPGTGQLPSAYGLSVSLASLLFPIIASTGRGWLRLSSQDRQLRPLRWDGGEPWQLWCELAPGPGGKEYSIQGSFRRGTERLPFSRLVFLQEGGLLFLEDLAARFDDGGRWPWILALLRGAPLTVPLSEAEEFLKETMKEPLAPRLDLPAHLGFEELSLPHRPRLMIRPPGKDGPGRGQLLCEAEFDYGGFPVPHDAPGEGAFDAGKRRRVLRDLRGERASLDRLRSLGFNPEIDYRTRREVFLLPPRKLSAAVRSLVADGWEVKGEGKVYRQAGAFRLQVTTEIDWFDLRGEMEFGSAVVRLPELLAALRKGDGWVPLGDGALGMLPEDLKKRFGMLAGLGSADGEGLRFRRNQVGLLDALLASRPEVAFDEAFARAREALQRFGGVEPADAGPDFRGQLRPYQREGLGWLHFLRDFGLGGCLADDMGLGKTVQVLALLESRRRLREDARAGSEESAAAGERPAPSLVVAPRSLVFNWKEEAARFTPLLKVLDHTGIHRVTDGALFAGHDVVLTTYGTLRRDALQLSQVVFDYVILDEAQAIKNANTESAKAARAVQGRHRLALSGTPIENHLGELWSLFEFLNPGMLGAAAALSLDGASGRNPGEETRSLLSRALRPFILRRTKEEVAPELPPRLEQVLHCELDPGERKLYDELREHYRRSLLTRVDAEGLNRSKIQVLEALLRLRQAAIHPGLIDPGRRGEPSAKLDLLLERLEEVVEEGHKALVFSQFTRMLGIVRERLERQGRAFEYLDGRTRDRGQKVARFQEDPECRLFLVSLKAGGLGLNLTAADYVFLLDPWWNPAVEAQAIDRTHRIGQARPVFAYRLIARDTVEEKVLELQKSKRDLVRAIITQENSLIRSLTRKDLEVLLG